MESDASTSKSDCSKDPRILKFLERKKKAEKCYQHNPTFSLDFLSFDYKPYNVKNKAG